MGGRRDWRKEGRKGREKGREGEGKGGGTCSKVLGGIDAPEPRYIETFHQLVGLCLHRVSKRPPFYF